MEGDDMMRINLLPIAGLLLLILTACRTSDAVYQIPNLPLQPGTMAQSSLIPFENNLAAAGRDSILLKNPDRGFRGEVYITLGSGAAYPSHNEDAISFLKDELETFGDENIQVLQCYVYLSEFHKRDLTDRALDQLSEYFRIVEASNKKILLRFAYDYSTSRKTGASTKQILRHLDQLDLWIEEEKELFHKTVYAVQLGLIGLWGEGHGESRRINKKKVIPRFTQIIPQNVPLQLRHPDFLEYVPDDQKFRFSIHDDFLVGVSHPWGMIPFKHEQYDALLNMNRFVPADGELPWGRDKTIEIDPLKVLDQIVNYSLTTLSLKHNYREEDGGDHPYILEKAREIILTEEYLEKRNYPFNPYMLTNGEISMFDYLQYHLGYNLAAGGFHADNGIGQFTLINFGMAAPFEYMVELRINDLLIEQRDLFSLTAAGEGYYIFEFPYTHGDKISLKLVHRRNPDQTIKLANDLPYFNGENIIKE